MIDALAGSSRSLNFKPCASQIVPIDFREFASARIPLIEPRKFYA